MKKILLLVMLFASVVFLNACGSTRSPMISDPDGVYLTAKEGNNTYTVKNGRIYELLKDQVGYSMVMDLIDRDLLKNTKNNGGVSYWDQVSQEDIDKRLEKDIFPEGTKEEEKEEKRKAHLDKLFADYGLITEADVFGYYRLLLARENYAKDQMEKQVTEKDFTETEYKNYFNNNFKDEYNAIVVSFDSYRMMEVSLKQLGYIFKDSDIAKADGTALTKDQIVKVFIELYNMVNSSQVKDYPDETLSLNEGVEYSVSNGKITFNKDNLAKLHYTYREISIYESSIQKKLATMDNYNTGDNFYTKTPQVYRNGSRYSLFMKIDQQSFDLEAKKPEIQKALKEQKLTTNYINTEIVKLRIANNIEIYDASFAENFISQAGAADIKYQSKHRDKFLVAKTDIKEYNADELFKAMNRNYGISSAISELEFNRFLDNPEINTIYNFNTKEAIDATRWTVIQQSIKDEKANFKKDMYKENGYPASMGWDKFIKAVYGASSESELERFFVFQDVKDRFAKSLGALTDTDTLTSEKWVFYLAQMEKMVAEYFNVTGVHLLITINDDAGNPVDPKNWTPKQVELAKEFYGQVMDYINNEDKKDTASKKIQIVQNAFNRAPYFVAGLPQDSSSQPVIEGVSYVFEGIELSKFKTAGLTALFQDLGSFTNGRMVKEFNDAAKKIWDENSNSEATVVYDSTPDSEGNYEYLVTQFGYHVYVNTKTTPIAEYATGKVLPTIGDAKEYLKDNNSSNLSTKLKTSLETYFKPIYTELTSTNKTQIVSYKAIRGLDITISHSDYSVADFQRFLDLTIETKEASLQYK